MKAEPGGLRPTFTPWSQWVREVAASKVALVTTAGVYLRHGLHEPFDLGREGGDPTFREFPAVVDLADVAIAGEAPAEAEAQARVNSVFPLDRLRAMAAAGVIDAVAPFAYSFSGAIADPLPLLVDSGPSVAYRIRRMGADAALVLAAGDAGLTTASIVARLIELAGISTVVLAADVDGLRTAGVPRGVALDPADWLQRLPDALEAAWALEAPGAVEL